MTLGLPQKDLAVSLGADVFTVLNWEKNRTLPSIKCMPTIIDFLGYIPYIRPDSFTEWFETVRRCLGLARSEVARRIGIDPGTLTRWLREQGLPPSDLHHQIRAALLRDRGP